MLRIAIIGCGAIGEAVAGYVADEKNVRIAAAIVNEGREDRARDVFGEGVAIAYGVGDLPIAIDVVADCAGHEALREHGVQALARGMDLVSVSSGALADAGLYDRLVAAARASGARLRVVAGAVGALDALAAGGVGRLTHVTYRGRKPPAGWRGSAAEAKLDLDALSEAAVHFRGNAREAALEYPQNANVAASIALAGVGFEDTRVELVADPDAKRNVHEIRAEGEFGCFEFRIEGRSLPGNPRSSALTAMSVVREILKPASPIVI